MFTYDPGLTSTASCESEITYIHGDEGVLLYRGYPIEQIAEHGDFLETRKLPGFRAMTKTPTTRGSRGLTFLASRCAANCPPLAALIRLNPRFAVGKPVGKAAPRSQQLFFYQ